MRRQLLTSALGALALALAGGLTLAGPAAAADLQMSADRSAARPGDSVLITGSGCAPDEGTVWLSYPGSWGQEPVSPRQSVPEVAADGSWTFEYRLPLNLTGEATVTATCSGYLGTTEFPSVTVTVDPNAATGVELVGVKPAAGCTVAVTVRAEIPGGWFFGPIHSEVRRAAEEAGSGDYDPLGLLEPAYFDLLPGQTRDLTWEVSPAALAERPEGFHVSALRTDNSVVQVLSLPWSTVPAEMRARCLDGQNPPTTTTSTSSTPMSTGTRSTRPGPIAGPRTLSDTGVDVGAVVGVGLLALLAGGGALVLARRDRSARRH